MKRFMGFKTRRQALHLFRASERGDFLEQVTFPIETGTCLTYEHQEVQDHAAYRSLRLQKASYFLCGSLEYLLPLNLSYKEMLLCIS